MADAVSAREFAAVAARYVGRRVMLTPKPRTGTIVRVTGRGLVVRLDDPVTAADVAGYVDE